MTAATFKTPGLYIEERSAFPASVVEVATAVPAFVGFTRTAEHAGDSLHNQPWRIGSMAEYTAHFGGLMRNRMAILDVWDGWRDRQGPLGDPVAAFRELLGADHLGFAAAYYPWVHTAVVDERELDGSNLLDPARLASLIRTELGLPLGAEAATPPPCRSPSGRRPSAGSIRPCAR